MVPHDVSPLNAEPGAWVGRCSPTLDELLELGVVSGNIDLHRNELVTALAVLGDEAAPLETENLPGGGPFRDGQHYRPIRRWHLHLGAEHGLLEGHGELKTD